MHEGRRRVDARREAKEPGAAAHLARFIEIACQDFLLDARRIARRRRPACIHIDFMKFEMRFVHRHRGGSCFYPSKGKLCTR